MKTDRELRWAATMAGHGDPARRCRCAGPTPTARPTSAPRTRLRPRPGPSIARRGRRWRTPSWPRAPPGPRGRGPEPPRGSRIRSGPVSSGIGTGSCTRAPFRRLAGKTQVFVFPDDHQRTRLTHALEVAQVATAVARVCRLNVALTEAIALGHDCGHGPGGHASEDALAPYLPEGFDHAVWGADVVLRPANLCRETSDGIRNHSWSRPAPATPEGEVVSWADRIAYVCHDFEDAVRAGIVTEEMLPPLGDRALRADPKPPAGGVHRRPDRRHPVDQGQVGMTESRGRGAGPVPGVQLRAHLPAPLLGRPGDGGHRLAAGPGRALRRPPQPAARRSASPGSDSGTEEALRSAVTYVAGMTDRFACQTAIAQLGWDRSRLPASRRHLSRC